MFIIIVVLMSVSLIGIITVQLYWINNAVQSRKEQFKNDVQKSLGRVAERINEKEERLIEIQIQDLFFDINSPLTDHSFRLVFTSISILKVCIKRYYFTAKD